MSVFQANDLFSRFSAASDAVGHTQKVLFLPHSLQEVCTLIAFMPSMNSVMRSCWRSFLDLHL